MSAPEIFDAVIVGGGPAGATAATDLAELGHRVLLLDRAGRIKPCGGAIPPRLIRDFNIPDHLLVAHATSARIVAPSRREVDMPVTAGGYVGMVDREEFDEWLRVRAREAGAERRTGTFETITRDAEGTAVVTYRQRTSDGDARVSVRARMIVGADGANSAVARQCIKGSERTKFVFAYHEIIRTPQNGAKVDGSRCEVHYDGKLSPDFYAWVFPHGETMSVGTGSANKGFSLKDATKALRERAGLDQAETLRREGAPIPLKPLRKWDNGRDVVLAGDAAGVVAPASGEGIYYAMLGGRLAANAVDKALETGNGAQLALARKQFMKAHRTVFWVLGIMQSFWYKNDARRERFVTMCDDKDVQHLTWQSYMHKELQRTRPVAHVKIFFKDLAHLCGIVSP